VKPGLARDLQQFRLDNTPIGDASMLPEDRYLDFLLTVDLARVAAEDGRIAAAHLRLYRGLEMAHYYSEPWSSELRELYRGVLRDFQQRYPWPAMAADCEHFQESGNRRSTFVAVL
jgi:hypothetical protein